MFAHIYLSIRRFFLTSPSEFQFDSQSMTRHPSRNHFKPTIICIVIPFFIKFFRKT